VPAEYKAKAINKRIARHKEGRMGDKKYSSFVVIRNSVRQ
jgi:hypothetical protein